MANESKLISIKIYPESLKLLNKEAKQRISVQAKFRDGFTQDITQYVTIGLQKNSIVSYKDGIFFPIMDGKSIVSVNYKSFDIPLQIECKNIKKNRGLKFKLDVMPIFLKAGCNTGSCHGSSRGQNGFRLSLFGYDPEGDYFRITREMSQRRINLSLPGKSLLLQKATKIVGHTGGKRFGVDSKEYKILINWLKKGAQKDTKNTAKPLGLRVYPKSCVLKSNKGSQQIIVYADYSDGSMRDVTEWAVFASNNDTVVNANNNGLLKAKKRGEAFITVRMFEYTVGLPVIVLPKVKNYQFPKIKPIGYVDEKVFNKWKTLKLLPSKSIDEKAFLRRLTIHLLGRLPTPAEAKRYVESKKSDKKSKIIDEYLKKDAFSTIWVMKWSEWLAIRSINNQFSFKSAFQYYRWLKSQIKTNVPVNEMARKLIDSNGYSLNNPETNFYLMENDPKKIAENVAQTFLGRRIQCAQCHNHVFDRWTQNDYYQFTSFFARIGKKKTEDPREKAVFKKINGETRHPVSKKIMKPKFLGGDFPNVSKIDRRTVLAKWISSKDNPYFAENFANRIWAHFFGKGIVDEIDDFRISNPPSNQELLKELSRKLVEYNFDFRKVIKDICMSHTYSLSSIPNETNKTDLRNYSKYPIQRMRAEIVLDCLSQVTGVPSKFPGLPLGARAIEISDGSTSNYFLKTFGRASRESVCSCEVKLEPNLSQALHLINGDTIKNKINKSKVLSGLIKSKNSPEKIIITLYEKCLVRKPLEKELKAQLASMKKYKNKNDFYKDLFWALLNSKEFMFVF